MPLSIGTAKKSVSICDTEPLTVMGLLHLLEPTDDLKLGFTRSTPPETIQVGDETDVLMLDKGFGTESVLRCLGELRAMPREAGMTVPAVIVWGLSMTEAEALRFLRAGARGILWKSAPLDVVLACIRAVGNGCTWMQDSIFKQKSLHQGHFAGTLTPREMQVMELAERGYKNTQIGKELAIQLTTVKIHLRHIFEKTGVRGRHGLALSRFRQAA